MVKVAQSVRKRITSGGMTVANVEDSKRRKKEPVLRAAKNTATTSSTTKVTILEKGKKDASSTDVKDKPKVEKKPRDRTPKDPSRAKVAKPRVRKSEKKKAAE